MKYRWNSKKNYWQFCIEGGTWQYSPQYNAMAPRADLLLKLKEAGHEVVPFEEEK